MPRNCAAALSWPPATGPGCTGSDPAGLIDDAVRGHGRRRARFRFLHIGSGAQKKTDPRCRRDDEQYAWWMSGFTNTFFFYVLYRSTAHAQPQLLKLAGSLMDRRLIVVGVFLFVVVVGSISVGEKVCSLLLLSLTSSSS
jgi:hypothetical protein